MVAVSSTDPTAVIVYAQVMRNVPSDSFFSVTNAGVVNVVGNIDREDEATYDVLIEVSVTARLAAGLDGVCDTPSIF